MSDTLQVKMSSLMSCDNVSLSLVIDYLVVVASTYLNVGPRLFVQRLELIHEHAFGHDVWCVSGVEA